MNRTRTASPVRRWPVLILVGLALLTGTATLPALPFAVAQPTGSAGTPVEPKFVKLTVDAVGPTAVTAAGDGFLTVTGTVTNIGDRDVDDISVRVQRGGAIETPSGLRTTLRPDEADDEVVGDFVDLTDQLAPGQRKQFALKVAVRPGTQTTPPVSSLGINAPGVYPVLLNINGQPAYGNQAHLDDARFLLPVLGLPPETIDGRPTGEGPVSAPTDAPVATTFIWPLADRPRTVAGIPGQADGKPLLTDDELAASLTTGGRLDQLLAAVESEVRTDSGRPGPGANPAAGALCLAIDPDLLLTVDGMTRGYKVLASPSDPSGPTRDGTGARAASAWLDRLKAVAAAVCTIATPFAQVDVSTLAAVADPDLSGLALDSPATVVDTLLSVKSVRGVALPAAGSVDEAGAQLLAAHGTTTAVLAANAVVPGDHPAPAGPAPASTVAHGPAATAGTPVEEVDAPEMVRLLGVTPPSAPGQQLADPGLRVATFDVWTATAMAAVGSGPPTPAFTPAGARFEVTGDSRPARLQDALGALAWSALNPQAGQRAALIMPPQEWGAGRDEATALLGEFDLLAHSGLITPRPFADVLTTAPDPRPFTVDYSAQVAADGVPGHYVEPVRSQEQRVQNLLGALVDAPLQKPTPNDFVQPLRDDLLRVLSGASRGSDSGAETAAQRRMDQITRTLDNIYDSVTVLPPGGVYTLASEQSPLLLVARNDLPVAIRIKFKIDAPAETNITDIGEQQLPAEGTRWFQVPSQVSDSRKLVIPISLTTPDGVPLGNATSVQVRSNAYGQALAIITACACVLLFLLTGRRLWRRFRGQPDPADEGLDPSKRRRLNRYLRARRRVGRQQEDS
ncbi:DUF6049 family protein [Nocardia stercoris]|uniref:Glycoprotein n=1 Tax=Nocardia stercoris TaxID=2483361 RepID=A0A3M2L9J5_9NOCA|nr:DUF6049 family protein [Nocardia stercoris]RMI34084.1 hypothetical protein EBN03_06515 [Nocardia stercoris]